VPTDHHWGRLAAGERRSTGRSPGVDQLTPPLQREIQQTRRGRLSTEAPDDVRFHRICTVILIIYTAVYVYLFVCLHCIQQLTLMLGHISCHYIAERINLSSSNYNLKQ